MPVQINEVIIKAVVDASPSNTTASSSAESSNNKQTEIMESVLEIIKEKQER